MPNFVEDVKAPRLVATTEIEVANSIIRGSGYILVPDATTYAIRTVNAGKVHVMPDLTADLTLSFPPEVDGLVFEFWYGGAAADAQDWIFDTGSNTNYLIGGLVQHDPDNAGDDTAVYRSDGNSNSKCTVFTPDVGTVVRFICNGVQWYVNGTVISTTDTGAAFADQ